MKVKININKFGKTLDEILDSKLSNAELPKCIGDMAPPVLTNELTIDFEDFFKIRDMVPPEKIVIPTLQDIIVDYNDVFNDHALDDESFCKLEKYKNDVINNYVNKIKKCITCSYTDICFKITKLYTEKVYKTIELNLT